MKGKAPPGTTAGPKLQLTIGPIVIVLIAVLAILHQVHFSYTADDAYITFRYARNWATGQGLGFNPDQPAVEGYTNFLWMAFLALHYRLGIHDLPLAAKLWGVLFGTLTIIVIATIKPSPSYPWRLVAPAFLALSAPFVFWVGSGMETPLFGLILLWLVVKITSKKQPPTSWFATGLWGAGCALLAMTRPEGVWLTGLTIGCMGVWGGATLRKAIKGVAVGFLIFYGPYFAWRYSYYGELLPNTFYAKSGDWWVLFQAGLRYLKDYALMYGVSLAPLLLLLRYRRNLGFREFYPLTLVVAYVGYIAWIGGDFMPYFRFMAPVYPLLALLYVKLTSFMSEDRSSLIKAVTPALAPFLAAAALWPSLSGAEYRQYRYEQDELFPRWTTVGTVLGQRFQNKSIACTAIGRIPYYSGLPTLDMLGLADKHIARRQIRFSPETRWHEKYDPDYVLKSHPDILLISNGLVTTEPSHDFRATAQEIGLFADRRRFESLYRPVSMKLPDSRYLGFFLAIKD